MQHNIQIPSDRNQSSKINQLTLKIDYLSEEIRTLSERNTNLEQILKLNQETMRTLKILDSSVQRSSYDITSTKTKANKSFPNIPILENLTTENKKLYEMLENISKECESLKSRVYFYCFNFIFLFLFVLDSCL